MNNTKEKYSFFQKGLLIIVEGRLNKDLEVINYDTSKCIKFSIAVDAGSKKENDEWVQITNWHNFILWDNGGSSKGFFYAIENPPSEKLLFQKGNLVKLLCTCQQNLRVYENKAYADNVIIDFLHMYKVLGNKNTTNNPNTESINGGF